MSRIRMRHTCVMSHVCVGYEESCQTYVQVIYVKHMYKSFGIYERDTRDERDTHTPGMWLMSHTWTSHTHTLLNICLPLLLYICTSPLAYMKESCRTYVWVMNELC